MGIPLPEAHGPASLQDLVLDPAVLGAATRELDMVQHPGRAGAPDAAQVPTGAVGSTPAAAAARVAVNDALRAAGAVSAWLEHSIAERAEALVDLRTALQRADQFSQTRARHAARPVATDARRST